MERLFTEVLNNCTKKVKKGSYSLLISIWNLVFIKDRSET
jgi:hypothetical protein